MAGRSELEAMISESHPDVARRFNRIARDQGFAPQMRRRWCELALARAASCTDLDEEQRAALKARTSALDEQLEPIRLQAIQTRLQIEPKIAQSGIDRMLGRKGAERIDITEWREPNAQQFRTLDELIESQLEALLAETACLETIPARRGKARP